MNITFKLTKAQVTGIRKYLEATSHDVKPKITNQEIKEEVQEMIFNALQMGAMGDYILEEDGEISK